MAGKAPNILIVMADQLAPQFLPAYGHPVVQAPNLSRLADEGVVFDSAYCNSPLCGPARYVMMTGRLPSKIGAWDNAAEWSSEVPTFAHYLAARGYVTALSGKMHFVGPDQRHGFAERLTTDVYPADFTWSPDWDQPDRPLDWFHNMEVVTKAGACVRAGYIDYDDEVLFQAQRWLFDRAREADEKPFMLTVSFIQPHDPYLARQENLDLYRADDIDLPKVPHGSVPEDPHSARLRRVYGADQVALSDEQIRNARHAYFGAVSDIDAKVGALLRSLAESGLGDDTVVVVTSDHGDMLGERGLWFKMSYFENSARVPLIVHAPSRFQARRVKEAVSHVDLLPTLMALAGDGDEGPVATPVEGRSLLPHLSGTGGHDEVIGEYFGEGIDTPLFMIRRGFKKFLTAAGDPPQLYDLAADPEERDNLAGRAEQAAACDALMAEVAGRWDVEALRERVIESQRRRRFLDPVMRAQGLSWDYEPRRDAATSYIRNNLPIYEIEKRSRFPQV